MGFAEWFSRRPAVVPATCPNCQSTVALKGQPVVMTYHGHTSNMGLCLRCIDCGLTYYVLEDGRCATTMSRAFTPAAPPEPRVEPPIGRPDLRVVRSGLEGLRMAPPEPEQE